MGFGERKSNSGEPRTAELFNLFHLNTASPGIAGIALHDELIRIADLPIFLTIRLYRMHLVGEWVTDKVNIREKIALYLEGRLADIVIKYNLKHEITDDSQQLLAQFLEEPLTRSTPDLVARYEDWYKYVEVLRYAWNSGNIPIVDAIARMQTNPQNEAPPPAGADVGKLWALRILYHQNEHPDKDGDSAV